MPRAGLSEEANRASCRSRSPAARSLCPCRLPRRGRELALFAPSGRCAAAVDAAVDALRLLDVDLPGDPGEAEVGAELRRTMESLARVGAEGLAAMSPTS